MTSKSVPSGVVLRRGLMSDPTMAATPSGVLKVGEGEEIICSFELGVERKGVGYPVPITDDDDEFSEDCTPFNGIYQDCRRAPEMSAWCQRVAVWTDVIIECVDGSPLYTKTGSPAHLVDPDYVLRLADFCEKHKSSENQCDHARTCAAANPPCATCFEGPRPNRFDEFPVVWRTGDTVHFDFNSVTKLHDPSYADARLAWPDALKLLATRVWKTGLGGHPHNVWVFTQVYKWRQYHWRICDSAANPEDCTRAHYYWTDHGTAAVDYSSGALIWLCGAPDSPQGVPTCADPKPVQD